MGQNYWYEKIAEPNGLLPWEEIEKLANLRNKISPIYTYFQLKDTIDLMKKEDPEGYEEIKEPLEKLFKNNALLASSSMENVKKILDSFGWNHVK